MKNKLLFTLLATLAAGPASLHAQTAFTYQGNLEDGCCPATGLYDLTFKIYDAATAGTQMGSMVSKLAFPLTNGLLTVSLDFGSGPFNGARRWLQIDVRTNNSALTPVTLLPRTELTATPIALYAGKAGSVVAGSVSATDLAASPTAGQVLGFNGSSLVWQSAGAGSGPWLLNGSSAYYGGGNVGIGTANPTGGLHISKGDAAQLYLERTGVITGKYRLGVAGANNTFYIQDEVAGGGTARLVIDGSGNVGIGTFSPQAPLHIQSSSQAHVRIVSGNTVNGSVLELFNTTSPLEYCGPDTPGQLTYGAINFGDGISVPGQIAYNGCTDSSEMTFRVGGSELVYFDGLNGVVGIGRRAFANRLEVEGNASKTTAGSWLANSDARIKTNIHSLTGALDKLTQVRLVGFHYTEQYQSAHPSIENREYVNVLAQEFQKVFPEHVKGSGEKLPNGEEILQVDTYPLTIYSAAAIQELNKLVRARDAKIASLEKQLGNLEKQLAMQQEAQQQLQARFAELATGLARVARIDGKSTLVVNQQAPEEQ